MEGSDDVICDKFSISRGGKTLFNDSKLSLIHGRRYGLIGPNGCGKSTLMHAIGTGEVEEIKKAIPPNTDILLVEQEVVASDEITALEMVVAADTRRTALLAEAKELEEKLEKGGVKYIKEAKLELIDGDAFVVGAKVRFEGREVSVLEEKDEDGDITIQDIFDEDGEIAGRLSEVYDELTDIGADSANQRASAILSGLQFLEEQKDWPTASFSGGWRMRISLARALFRKPRLLLLDEPTNHLDLHAVIWLEGYLQKWKHTLVVVSHDRSFLSTVCTDILHCWRRKLVAYQGNYEVFEKVFSSKLEEYNKEFERQQKRLKELRKQGKVSKDLGKKDGGADSAAYKKQMQQVLGKGSKGKELAGFSGAGGGSDDEEELLEQIKGTNMHIHFTVAGEIPMPILAVDNVSFNYEKQQTLFTDVDFGLNMDSRVALVGANGTGKSTLLKLMLDELEPVKGEVRQSRMCKIGVYNQHSCDQLAGGVRLAKGQKLTPVSYLTHIFPDLSIQDARNALGKFGLEGHHHLQEIETLSGGQKSRVVFVELGLRRCHLLLLDEPTNHLDLETVDCLVNSLRAFKGGVLVITHNVALISQVCNQIWVIEDKKVEPFKGEFEEYRDMLAEQLNQIVDEDPEEKKREREAKERKEAKEEAAAAARGEAPDPNKPKSKAQRDRERAEARAVKQAKDEAEAAAKKAAAEAEAAAAAAAELEAARLKKEAEEAELLRSSQLAQASINASKLPLSEALALMVAAASPLQACGGLYVLCQKHAPLELIAPLLAAIFDHGSPPSESDEPPAETAPVPEAEPSAAPAAADAGSQSAAAQLLTAWCMPIAWLVCRCDDRQAAQRELLRAYEDACIANKQKLLSEAAPLLKAIWQSGLVEEQLLLEWADTNGQSPKHAYRCARKYADPFVAWLRTAEVME